MEFKDILKGLVESVPGAAGAIFVDWEGEAVEYFFAGADDDIKLLGAHHGILLNLLRDASENMGQGKVQRLMVATETAKVMVQTLKDGYFLVAVASPVSNTGRAYHMMDKAAKILNEDI